MGEIWNKNSLESPPLNTAKVKIMISEVQELFHHVNEFNQIFPKIGSLDQEAALLSRVIYRMKHKFRHDKGFKTLEKVNRALLQYLNANYDQQVQTFLNMIDTDDFTNSYIEKNIYLPTKQLLQYLLVRTQGFAKLLCRIVESCQITADYMNARLSSGQSWPLALLVIGLTSRIHTIAAFLIRETCKFYDGVIKFESILRLNGPKWLPEEYTFPKALFKWLDFELLEINCSSNVPIAPKIEPVSTPMDLGTPVSREEVKSTDLGQPISRDYFKSIFSQMKNETTTKQKVKKHKCINNLDTLSVKIDKQKKKKKLKKMGFKTLKAEL